MRINKSKNHFIKAMAFVMSLVMIMSSLGIVSFAADDTNTASVYDLRDSIMTYELKMAYDRVYTNTKEAYDAYVNANRIYDAINYGNADISPNQLYQVCNRLNTAIDNMKEFEYASVNTVYSSFTDDNAHDNNYNYNDVCRNLLWCSDVTYDTYTMWGEEQGVYTGSNKNTVQPAIFRPSAVMFYDGTDPSIPVMFLERLWKGGAFGGQLNMWTFYAALTGNTQGMYMNQNWRGTDGKLNFIYCYGNNGDTGLNYNYGEVDSFHKISRNNSKGEHKYYYANRLMFDGSSFGPTEYIRTINNLTWGFLFTNNDDPYYDNGDSHSKNFVVTEGDKNGVNKNEVEQPIYVINYKALKDEISKYTASKLNVAAYKEGGLSGIFTACDKLTAFNPISEYDWNNNAVASVSACGKRIEDLIATSKNAQIYQPNYYSNLKSAISQCRSDYNNAAALSVYYSKESFDRFINTYEIAQAEFVKLVYNAYSSDKTYLDNLATELEDSRNNLKRLYVLTFKDENGETIDIARMESGASVSEVAQSAPTLPDYEIIGDYLYIISWDKPFTVVTGNATYMVKKTQSHDVSAYLSAIAVAEECINNTHKYSQTEIDSIKQVLDENKLSSTSTAEDIDAFTAAITTAISNLNVRRCNITLVEQVDSKITSTKSLSYMFGETVTINGPSNASVIKWGYNIDGEDSIIARDTDALQFTVDGDAVITAYAQSSQIQQDTQQARVILIDKSGKVVSITYAAIGSIITFRSTTYSVAGVNAMAKRVPFYTANGFVIDSTAYSLGSEYTITDDNDIVIQAVYNA